MSLAVGRGYPFWSVKPFAVPRQFYKAASRLSPHTLNSLPTTSHRSSVGFGMADNSWQA